MKKLKELLHELATRVKEDEPGAVNYSLSSLALPFHLFSRLNPASR
jgi:hypothetical protein